MKKITTFIGFGALALVLFYSLSNQTDDVAHIDLVQAKQVNQTYYESPTRTLVEEQHIPETLKGIDYPIEFKVDTHRKLLPTYAVRELFDHYLSSYGEIELDQIITLIQSEINEQLDEPAKSEALWLLKRYIDYKIALAENAESLNSHQNEDQSYLEQVIAKQSELRALRESYFSSDEYESFFGLEDTQNAYMIEQIRINTDPSLSPQQKKTMLNEAQTILPEEIVQSRQKVQKHAELREHIAQLREEGANHEDVFRAREESLGTEAANALADLDQQRAEWKAKVSEFSEARNDILNSGLSDTDKNASIDALLASNFEPSEQKRVMAIVNEGLIN